VKLPQQEANLKIGKSTCEFPAGPWASIVYPSVSRTTTLHLFCSTEADKSPPFFQRFIFYLIWARTQIHFIFISRFCRPSRTQDCRFSCLRMRRPTKTILHFVKFWSRNMRFSSSPIQNTHPTCKLFLSLSPSLSVVCSCLYPLQPPQFTTRTIS